MRIIDTRKIYMKITKEAKNKMQTNLKELSKIDKTKTSSKIRSKNRNHINCTCRYYRYFNYFSNNKY